VCTVTLTEEGRENDHTHTQMHARMNVHTQWCEYVFRYTHNDENWGTHTMILTSLCVYVYWRRAREWSYTHTDARENELTRTMIWVRLHIHTQWWELRYTHNETHIIVCVRWLKKSAKMNDHTQWCARELTYTHTDVSPFGIILNLRAKMMIWVFLFRQSLGCNNGGGGGNFSWNPPIPLLHPTNHDLEGTDDVESLSHTLMMWVFSFRQSSICERKRWWVSQTARKASWSNMGVEPGNQEGPGC